MKCFSNTFVHYVYFFTLQKENRTGEHSTEGFNSYGVVRSHDALDCVVGFSLKVVLWMKYSSRSVHYDAVLFQLIFSIYWLRIYSQN